MAEQTTNYGLVKPAPDEFYDVSVPNRNMEIIDSKMKELETNKANGTELTTLNNKVTQHFDETVAQMIPVERDLSLSGTQRIATNFKAKSVSVLGFVNGTKLSSRGFWAENNIQRTMSTDSNGVIIGWNSLLRFTFDGTANATVVNISNVNNDGFDLIWTTTGSGAYAGNAILLIIAHGHGGDA